MSKSHAPAKSPHENTRKDATPPTPVQPGETPEPGPLDVEGGVRTPDGKFQAEHRPSR